MPIRGRLTAMFVAGTAVVLIAFGIFVYTNVGRSLLDAVDTGLRTRAEVTAADVRDHGPGLAQLDTNLIETDEGFAQVTDASGRVIQSSPIVSKTALLPPAAAASITGPKAFNREIPGIDNLTRMIAEPVSVGSQSYVVIAATSLQDRRDSMISLAATLAIGGPIALVLLSVAFWLITGAALRPVEQMRAEAAAISPTEPSKRLAVPPAGDELTRLATTLNQMLDRLQASYERERDFVNKASHELRTPLGVLRAELDLALARSRTPVELEAAIRSAAGETDRLVRLAEDLLVLARSNDGVLPVHREDISLAELVTRSSDAFAAKADQAGVRIEVEAADQPASLDPIRVRQALDNLLDNAIRQSKSGDTVVVRASRNGKTATLEVRDEGPGFTKEVAGWAFEPFVEGDGTGAGLGLAIVRAVAEGHGGEATVENLDGGGARVTLEIPF